MKMWWKQCAAIVALLMVGVATAGAESLEAVQQRMIDRLPQLEALWKSGRTGENNAGFVAVRGELNKEERKLVDAENRDRQTVYAAIATRTDTATEQVGRQRAAQIAKRAEPGLWLQDSKGNWYRKPE